VLAVGDVPSASTPAASAQLMPAAMRTINASETRADVGVDVCERPGVPNPPFPQTLYADKIDNSSLEKVVPRQL